MATIEWVNHLEHQIKRLNKSVDSLQNAVNRKHQQLLDARKERDDAIQEKKQLKLIVDAQQDTFQRTVSGLGTHFDDPWDRKGRWPSKS